MKVLQVGSSLRAWGGIERYLVYLERGLTDRGHDVRTCVPPGSPLESRLQGAVSRIGLSGQLDVARIPAFLRLYRREKFDVVNVHFSPDYLIPAIAARLARQRNLVLTRHVALPWKPSRVRRYGRLYDGFIAVSEAVKTKLVESGLPGSRVEVALSGIPPLEPTLPKDAMRERLAIRGFAIGFFGRVVEDKGVQTLMDAAGDLPPETFHVFGDGPRLAEYKSLGSPVRFHGRVEDVANAMNAMDAVVVPSLWEEAFGLSSLEAMTLGKPVLATRAGGLSEVVADGESGLLFSRGDAHALVALARELMERPDWAARLGEKGRQIHRARFGVEHMADRVEAAYHSILAGPPV